MVFARVRFEEYLCEYVVAALHLSCLLIDHDQLQSFRGSMSVYVRGSAD